MSGFVRVLAALLLLSIAPPWLASAQQQLAIDQFLSPAYPFELVSAKKADRIAWLSYEQGRRNVYTAAAPAFRPVKLTKHVADNGIDLTSLRISDDGSIVVFVRGHAPNREGWVANPASSPDGAQRTIWAARTSGGPSWRVAEGGDPVLSPDGRFVLYVKDGQVYRARVSAVAAAAPQSSEKPFITAYGRNSDPTWSPDGSRIAFVSDRGDHSLIAVYDVRSRAVTYVAPNVDRDSSPAWSPDGRRIAFIRRPGSPFAQIIAQAAAARGSAPGRGKAPGGRGGRSGRGGQSEEGPQIPGLTRAALKGGYTLSLWVADVKTGAGVATTDGTHSRVSSGTTSRTIRHLRASTTFSGPGIESCSRPSPMNGSGITPCPWLAARVRLSSSHLVTAWPKRRDCLQTAVNSSTRRIQKTSIAGTSGRCRLPVARQRRLRRASKSKRTLPRSPPEHTWPC